MAQKDLSMLYAKSKTDTEIALAQIRRAHNLPAFLMASIIDGVSAKLQAECVMELSERSLAYAEEIAKENEKKEEQHNASDES